MKKNSSEKGKAIALPEPKLSFEEESEKTVQGREGHRERVRNRVNAGGISDMQEHEIIEYLLHAGIPYKDTKDVAYALVGKFGNLYGIANASYESLLEIKGMTGTAAVLLRSVTGVSERYVAEMGMRQKSTGVDTMLGYTGNVIKPDVEACYVLNLGEDGTVLGITTVAEGEDTRLNATPEAILRTAFNAGYQNVIVVHNHPSGTAYASEEDRALSYSLSQMMRGLRLNLIDHVVTYDKFMYSMKNKKIYDRFSEGEGE